MRTSLQNLIKKINDSSVSVSELLRIMYVIMMNVDDTQILSWIKAESDGYDRYPEIRFPEYRKITGQLKCLNPYRGWIPIIDTGQDAQLMREVSSKYISLSICEIEKFIVDNEGKDLEIKLARELELLLIHSVGTEFRPAIVIPVTRFVPILHSVRQKILDLALNLSENDIDEKARAMLDADDELDEKTRQTNITSYHTTVCSAENVMVQQGSPNAQQALHMQSIDIDEIKKILKETRYVLNNLDEREKKEGTAYLDVIENEIVKDNLDETKIRMIFSYVHNLLENVSANLIANGIIAVSPLILENMSKIKEFVQ